MLLVAAVISIVGALIYMLIDASISLNHSRSQNQMLGQKCELLARLVDNGLRGRTTEAVIESAGPKVLAKVEGNELHLDNLVLRVEDSKVTGVDTAETCR
ncbi:MAG: hypothetical protein EON54_09920 [Alcaligenaceae bacterium]|nr:MAG: hypothetical protein EON54_09920 [Alcaligenaceae bacterium]